MSNSVICNLCGVDEETEVFGPGVAQPSRIVRCNRCRLMYASPRANEPDHVWLAKVDPTWDLIPTGGSRFVKERLQVRDYARTRVRLGELYSGRGKLLEIGCGLGFLLREFREDGWNVLGIDSLLQACRFGQDELGIEVHNGTLEDIGLPDESFDVVLMNHVIEHLDDPKNTLCEVSRVLKPGGQFVIETPRYDTLIFKILGRRERSIAWPGHTFFFTTQTLRWLYESAGFETVRLDYVGRSLTFDRLLWNLGVVSKNEWVQCSLARVSSRLQLNSLSKLSGHATSLGH